jgi:uncharacterized YccA/Bax inhibitor family protein
MNGNPLLANIRTSARRGENALTINGVCFRTAILLAICFLSATWVWNHLAADIASTVEVVRPKGHVAKFMSVPGYVYGYLLGGALSAFVVAMITIASPGTAFLTAPIYAALEGLSLGAISVLYAFAYGGGIVWQSLAITFGIMAGMLLLYLSRLVRPTQGFAFGLMGATVGVLLLYLATIVLGAFGIEVPLMYSTGWGGILMSLVILTIASLYFVLDFGQIEEALQDGVDKSMGWYLGFGLMLTIVWVYLEVLQLLAKAKSDD